MDKLNEYHKNCLIVDDEIELAEMTKEYFELFGVTCDTVADGLGCLEMIEQGKYDVVLLDINLQEENGFKVCKTIREKWNMPILFISARQSDEDILVALNIGGDDYIKKPYTLSVLLAKVKAVLKRAALAEKNHVPEDNVSALEDGKLRLEESSLKAYINGREVVLKAKEFKLLKCLFDNRNTIVKKETLFDMVWGDTYFSDGTLNVHIRKLREKLEENPNEPKLIKTIWGTGYILETKEL
ncbi:MAG: response regulator transcription factor [Lachnospiraceae bacterium]|nr:response regulator transcription factor [Lachnospiraceae bacterium]